LGLNFDFYSVFYLKIIKFYYFFKKFNFDIKMIKKTKIIINLNKKKITQLEPGTNY